MNINLNSDWTMCKVGESEELSCNVPCSVYKTLLEHKRIPDPYYRENEYISTHICDDDYIFQKKFSVSQNQIDNADRIFLKFEQVDTLSEIYLNGEKILATDNMHRVYQASVKSILKAGENVVSVKIFSPNKYIGEKYAKRKLWGVDTTMEGYPYLRKAHCMFGWDWGPKLPDMGILRNVTLSFCSLGRINNIYYIQEHFENSVKLTCKMSTEMWIDGLVNKLIVTSPDGKEFTAVLENGEGSVVIDSPKLWWVRGYGEQPMYRCRAELVSSNGEVIDSDVQNIGLRTLTVSQEKDEWGEEFCFINNGVKIFAMGANYIPEDQIVSRCTKERTVKLLEDCKKANFNFIRVWGGGYYPDDYFYDYCDKNGIVIWQDFMFACSAYLLEDDFKFTVEQEIINNVVRLRNHPSLGLWCGNNEIESAWEYWGLPEDKQAQSDYLVLFEDIIPNILKKYDPNTFYWPSSPSSGGGFKDASSNHAGDMHYWDVWHNFKPIEDFRKYYYRFCSEYGFEALPDIKTCRAFADESKGDFDLCGNVMQAHQKCVQGNEKVMFYLAQMVNYPYDFERLIYCSQLVQADCIRSNVEHMRRARGRCMGSAYWQVNDSNPVISWASIDYFGRWKGLHYLAKRFYAPCLLSVDDSDALHPVFNISNERTYPFNGTISWTLRNNKAEIITAGSADCRVEKLSAENVLTADLSEFIKGREDKRRMYLEYRLEENGEVISCGTTLFVRPKEYDFLPPKIVYGVKESAVCGGCKDDGKFRIVLEAENFAKSVCISLKDYDAVFSDNWFDIHGKEQVEISVDKKYFPDNFSLKDFDEQIEITSY